ncbi:MAG: peptidoglycan editing factor PgeF [Pseudomonadota bacterium]
MTSVLNPVSIQAPELEALPGIRHAFFTRSGGASMGLYDSLNAGLGSGDDRTTVETNRAAMAKALGAQQIVSPYQIHSDIVVTAEDIGAERPKADGLTSATPGLAIGIVTADCGPVLFADANARIIAACHAGWKGALAGMLEHTLDAMVARGASRDDIVAVLGPTIQQRNYEVGPTFPDPFLLRDPTADRYFAPSTKADHHMFDLPAYIVDRLRAAGVTATARTECTYDGDFFSYRRATHRGETDYGRQMSAILLEA